MKKNLLILFAVGMMVTVKPTVAQESVRFFGAEQAYSISTERLDEEFSNVEVFTNNLPQDLQYLWDEYCVRFPSKGTHELAVAVMKTNRGLPVFVQQTKTGKIKRLVIFSRGYGWIEASSEAKKFLEWYLKNGLNHLGKFLYVYLAKGAFSILKNFGLNLLNYLSSNSFIQVN